MLLMEMRYKINSTTYIVIIIIIKKKKKLGKAQNAFHVVSQKFP